MRKNRLVLSVLIISVLLCTGLPAAAMADSGPIYFSAGVLVPTTSNDIRMTREVLTIDYTNQVDPIAGHRSGTVDVHARFWFRNEGKAVVQKMGFPLGREHLSGFGFYDSGFKVTVDGIAITTSPFDNEHPADSSELTYDQWNTFEVPFAVGETHIIDATYSILPRSGYFLYVLQTGRLWKGPIGDLTIDVNFGREPGFPDLLSVQPAGYHTQGDHILWHFTDYEPQQDIEIESMYAGFWKSVLPLKNAAERTGAEADWYRYAMALLPDNIVGKYPGDMMESVAALSSLGFVRGLQTSAYADYVQRTLITALNHCMHGSADAQVLRAAYGARFSYYRVTGDFLNGVDIWKAKPSTRAHDIYGQLAAAGLTTTKASSDEARLLAWLTVNMVGESMSGGYSLSALHELDQSQAFAVQAGILKSGEYQDQVNRGLMYLNPSSNPRLLVGVPVVPRIEIQQQRMDTIVGGPAWRARIVMHQTLPSSDAQFARNDDVSSQPDWKTMPEIDNVTWLVKDSTGSIWSGFSDTDSNDHLVVLNLPGFRNVEEFQKILNETVHQGFSDSLLQNRTPTSEEYQYYYPVDAARNYSIQSGSYTWLQAIGPNLSFDATRGVIMTVDPNVPMANALCDKADTELKWIVTMFGKLSYFKSFQIDKTLQRNLDLVEQTRGKNPSVTTVTYAADGTVAKTVTTERAGETRRSIWVVVAGIGGLVAGLILGLFVASRKKNTETPRPGGQLR